MSSFANISATSEEDLTRNTTPYRHKNISSSSPDNISTIDEGNRSIDHILDRIVGGGGWGQWIIVIASYPVIYCSMSLLMHMFTAFEPRHRCFVPICDRKMRKSLKLILYSRRTRSYAVNQNRLIKYFLENNFQSNVKNISQFILLMF